MAIQNTINDTQKQLDDDYKNFCIPCGWNDPDYGCTSPSGEELWQCPLYIHYHPKEVAEFEKDMEEWAKEQEKSSKPYQEQVFDLFKPVGDFNAKIISDIRDNLNSVDKKGE